jgi:ribose transport system substrate-binding protein
MPKISHRANLLTFLAIVACVLLPTGCSRKEKVRDGKKQEDLGSSSKRKFYWIQPVKGHPVHQLTQIAFREGCKSLGYACEILGTDGADIGGTIGLAEQSLARGDAAGLAIWTGNPAYNSFIEKAGKVGIPVILPHFPAPEGSIPGASGIISCDPKEYGKAAALEIGQAIGGKGTVAITQGSFNSTENMVAREFGGTLHEKFPEVKVLEPIEEGFDVPTAMGKAVSVLQAHPDLVAAFSTTGGGPVTWAKAQKETGRKIVIIGMDYTRINLDLVKSGEVHAVVGQPLWEESFGAAELLAKVVRGEKIPWWTKLQAPLITKDKLDSYNELLKKVENAIQ